MLGVAVGLIWSPCVGPIMASVIATAVSVGPTPEAVTISLAYVVGASVPLAAIALGGRRAARRLGSAERRSGLVRAFGALTVAAGLLVVTGLDVPLQARLASLLPSGWTAAMAAVGPVASTGAEASTPAVSPGAASAPLRNIDGQPLPPQLAETLPARVALQDLGPAPELAGITDWINSDPLTVESLRGKVVLVHFWTFGCSNCVNVQPYVKAWHERYADAGLVVVGVHTPEFAYEREAANVREAVSRAGVRFPVALDPRIRDVEGVPEWRLACVPLHRPRGQAPLRERRRGQLRRPRAGHQGAAGRRLSTRRLGTRPLALGGTPHRVAWVPHAAQVADPVGGLAGLADVDARRQHRQHRAARDPAGLRDRPDHRRVGRGRLPARPGQPAAPRRPPRRGPDVQARLPRGLRDLHPCQRPVRGGPQRGSPGRLPAGPGGRSGHDHGDGPGDHHPHVPRR